jgi:hypothetical protein
MSDNVPRIATLPKRAARNMGDASGVACNRPRG